jgi:alkylation response protein AidB-like acyl-CoA dehydrogenase
MAAGYVPQVDALLAAIRTSRHAVGADAARYDQDAARSVLTGFGELCAEVFAPLDAVGDRQPASWDPATGAVTTSPGWPQAWSAYAGGGWSGVPFPERHGGGGLPWSVGMAMQELLTAANMAFSLCGMLTQGAIELLDVHGTASQQATYLPKLVSGEWTGTMNLTEPQAGSDVGAITTRARPAGDAYLVTGDKIWITYGEHDLTENIVHLVLARLPGAPTGTRGISLFVVPKRLVLEDGSLGAVNGVRCTGIEHKMGIHGSPTCSMHYEDAVGELVGEPGGGLAAMFTMMNVARLSVGIEGLGLAERARQAATSYAHERIQGRGSDRAPAVIAQHPDVRRMLLTADASVGAMRMLTTATAAALDLSLAEAATDAERVHGREVADLLTPLAKAWCTDQVSVITRLATQVHGGAGYVADTGVEQHERDARITSIYEGTNGIQAIDLVSRKLPVRGGAVLFELLEERVKATASSPHAAAVALACDRLAAEARSLLTAGGDDVLAAAAAFLEQAAVTVAGALLVELADDEPRWAPQARWFVDTVLIPAATAQPDLLTRYASLAAWSD